MIDASLTTATGFNQSWCRSTVSLSGKLVGTAVFSDVLDWIGGGTFEGGVVDIRGNTTIRAGGVHHLLDSTLRVGVGALLSVEIGAVLNLTRSMFVFATGGVVVLTDVTIIGDSASSLLVLPGTTLVIQSIAGSVVGVALNNTGSLFLNGTGIVRFANGSRHEAGSVFRVDQLSTVDMLGVNVFDTADVTVLGRMILETGATLRGTASLVLNGVLTVVGGIIGGKETCAGPGGLLPSLSVLVLEIVSGLPLLLTGRTLVVTGNATAPAGLALTMRCQAAFVVASSGGFTLGGACGVDGDAGCWFNSSGVIRVTAADLLLNSTSSLDGMLGVSAASSVSLVATTYLRSSCVVGNLGLISLVRGPLLLSAGAVTTIPGTSRVNGTIAAIGTSLAMLAVTDLTALGAELSRVTLTVRGASTVVTDAVVALREGSGVTVTSGNLLVSGGSRITCDAAPATCHINNLGTLRVLANAVVSAELTSSARLNVTAPTLLGNATVTGGEAFVMASAGGLGWRVSGGSVHVSGVVEGNVHVTDGELVAGELGIARVTGSFVLGNDAICVLHLATFATEADAPLQVAGAATLDGELDVTLPTVLADNTTVVLMTYASFTGRFDAATIADDAGAVIPAATRSVLGMMLRALSDFVAQLVYRPNRLEAVFSVPPINAAQYERSSLLANAPMRQAPAISAVALVTAAVAGLMALAAFLDCRHNKKAKLSVEPEMSPYVVEMNLEDDSRAATSLNVSAMDAFAAAAVAGGGIRPTERPLSPKPSAIATIPRKAVKTLSSSHMIIPKHVLERAKTAHMTLARSRSVPDLLEVGKVGAVRITLVDFVDDVEIDDIMLKFTPTVDAKRSKAKKLPVPEENDARGALTAVLTSRRQIINPAGYVPAIQRPGSAGSPQRATEQPALTRMNVSEVPLVEAPVLLPHATSHEAEDTISPMSSGPIATPAVLVGKGRRSRTMSDVSQRSTTLIAWPEPAPGAPGTAGPSGRRRRTHGKGPAVEQSMPDLGGEPHGLGAGHRVASAIDVRRPTTEAVVFEDVPARLEALKSAEDDGDSGAGTGSREVLSARTNHSAVSHRATGSPESLTRPQSPASSDGIGADRWAELDGIVMDVTAPYLQMGRVEGESPEQQPSSSPDTENSADSRRSMLRVARDSVRNFKPRDFTRGFLRRLWSTLKRRHRVLSLACGQQGNMTHLRQAVYIGVSLYTYLLANAFFFARETFTDDQVAAVAFYTSLMVTVPVFMLGFLLARIRASRHPSSLITDGALCCCCCTCCGASRRCCLRWDRWTLPHKSIFPTFVVSFLYMAFAAYTILLYGVTFEPVHASKWLTSVAVSFLWDVVVQQPLIILLTEVFGVLSQMCCLSQILGAL